MVVKRSVIVSGHKTSISLEDPFWKSLKEVAGSRHLTMSGLLAAIGSQRHEGNLSSAIRLFLLKYYRDQLAFDRLPVGELLTLVVREITIALHKIASDFRAAGF